MFRVIGVHNHYYIHVDCGICGQGFKRDEPAFLLRDDEDQEPCHFLDVCPECMGLDADGLRARVRAHAEELRAQADHLEEQLEHLLEEGIKAYDASEYPDTFCEGCGLVHGATMKHLGVVDLDAEEDAIPYFGGCPECRRNDRYLNVGREQWFVCDQHRTKWRGVSNMFSSWQYETEEQWARNAEMLEGYREVEPVLPTAVDEAVDDEDIPF